MLDFKNWAVAGDVLNEEKVANLITKRLSKKGYNVFSVNPRTKKPEVYKSLKEIEGRVDVIDLCIHPKSGIKIMEEAKELGIDKVFIQPGAESDEILEFCAKNNITVFEGCVLLELNKKYPMD